MSMMDTTNVITNEVKTEKLTMGEVTSERIAAAMDQAKQRTDLAAVGYVNERLDGIDRLMKKLAPEGSLLSDLAAISTPLLEPYFNDPTEWAYAGWEIIDNQAIGYATANSQLWMHSGVFAAGRSFMLTVKISQISDGATLDVFLDSQPIGQATEAGEYHWEFTCENDSSSVTFKVRGDDPTDQVVIPYIGLFSISKRFKDYLTKKFIELSPVDMTQYVTKHDYTNWMNHVSSSFAQLTENFNTAWKQHLSTSNPHGITPDGIGAATQDHVHPDNITASNLPGALAELIATNPDVMSHNHDEIYVRPTEMKEYFSQTVDRALVMRVWAEKAVLTNAPKGILPPAFDLADVDYPTTHILPSRIGFEEGLSYDYNRGRVTTNVESLQGEAGKVFDNVNSADYPTEDVPFEIPNVMARIPYSVWTDGMLRNELVAFKLQLHSARSVLGYQILTSSEAKLKEWVVTRDNDLPAHEVRVQELEAVEKDGKNYWAVNLYFPEPGMIKEFGFQVKDGEVSNNWDLKINLITVESGSDELIVEEGPVMGVAPDGFRGSVGFATNNRLNRLYLTPPQTEVPMDYYVFADCRLLDTLNLQELQAPWLMPADVTLSVYPPEFGHGRRRGFDILQGKFKGLAPSGTREHYDAGVFGELELMAGSSLDDEHLVKNVFDVESDGFLSAEGCARVCILNQFNIGKPYQHQHVLMGYKLSWKHSEQYIPEHWTLTVSGFDNKGALRSVVFDSVKDFVPMYSAADDEICYATRKNIPSITVDKISLVMDSSKGKIALQNLSYYLSEDYYDIPSNTHYRGVKNACRVCIGKVHHTPGRGYDVVNACLSKQVVYPVKHLSQVSAGQYTIPNPFFADRVSCSLVKYQVLGTRHAIRSPLTDGAYITSVSCDAIVADVPTAGQYAVVITREW